MDNTINSYVPSRFSIDAEADSPVVNGRHSLSNRNSPSARGSAMPSFSGASRRPISPPPLKRSSTGTASIGGGFSPDLSTRPPPPRLEDVGDGRSMPETDKPLGIQRPDAQVSAKAQPRDLHEALSQENEFVTPSSPCPLPQPAFMTERASTPQSSMASDWTVPDIIHQLEGFSQDIKDGHARMTTYAIESTSVPEWRVRTGRDHFAGVKIQPNTEKLGMRAKFKQHSKKREHRKEHYMALPIKTTKERVPRYRFHHVEIKKNVLTPHTSLTFYPHLRDLESSEEKQYNMWLKELEDIDLQSGFKPMNREEKAVRTAQSERARTLSLYLESWLEKLAIPGCNKSSLIQCMATQEPDDAITPQQKTDILKSQQRGDNHIPGLNKAAEMFSDAFRQVFEDGQHPLTQILLRDVLFLDESVDNIMDSKPTAKDGNDSQNENEDDLAERHLGTYCILGCLICFSHSCEHGEYDNTNIKRTFSISSSRYRLRDVLRRRRTLPYKGQPAPLVNGNGIHDSPCQRSCYRAAVESEAAPAQPFSDDEIIVLRSIYTTADHSKVKKDPICLAADFLNRDCWEVHLESEKLGLSSPPSHETLTKPPARGLSWYDRYRKVLIGDWQEHTETHQHQRRDVLEPCFHDGPCAPKICSCVDAGLLCERFCGCTVESCVYKFNGCNCHAQGKICQRKHQEKSSTCICVQLNRECDPTLCGSCGAVDRADPQRADEEELHATGCQNCELQRGVSKALLLGQSQLDGVGYGLFTAEDILQDAFVVEYVGELIVHDEGVRREARRGDVFDEESTISYLFTLLENEGIWVDAAQYGNLSRYINHAPESEKRGCNITPRILYVNGEFRIKFTALRDIKAGEELFFNYGEEFPNLTKKLLDNKAEEGSVGTPRRKPKKQTRGGGNDKGPRKGTKGEKRKPGRPRTTQKATPSDEGADDMDVDTDWNQSKAAPKQRLKRKRRTSDSAGETTQPSPVYRKRQKGYKNLRETVATTTAPLRRDQGKTRGKRGGARPGSGRPRKHPRPGSANASGPSGAKLNGQTAPASTLTPETAAGSAPAQSSAAAGSAAADTPTAAASSPTWPRGQNEDADGSGVWEIQDSYEEQTEMLGDDEDEDDDQDVVVRKRQARARHRRPPKKFRDNVESDGWA